MRPLRALVIYIVVVFLGGALLAPWLYWLAQACAHFLPRIAASPFHRFVDRSLLILALAGVWPLLRALGARSGRDLGLTSPVGQWPKWLGGFLLGFISLAFVAGITLAAGGRTLNQGMTASRIAGILFGAAATAIVVAVLEEILFRGGIFGSLRRGLPWTLALAISSLVYALAHFLQRGDLTGPVTWHSGLELLSGMFGGMADARALVPGFFNLALAGVLLGLAYQRTGNLYFSIGLHAGWIFWLKTYGVFTGTVPQAAAWFWGTNKMIDGWPALIVLALTLAVMGYLPPGKIFKTKT